jgi:hypothetical protein
MRRLFVFGMALVTVAAIVESPIAQSQLPLVAAGNLRYDGAFRLPTGSNGGTSFEALLSGTALTYYPANNSLLLVGREPDAKVAEVSIPTPTKPSSSSSLPTATFRQGFSDIFEGRRESTSSSTNGHLVGGLLVWGNSLISTVFAFYDATYSQTRSHYISGMNLATTGDLSGPFQVGDKAGVVSGYMTALPAAWHSALGGPALTGNCCLPITTRTSSGPAASVFNPADVGVRSPVPATPVVGYDEAHAPGATVFLNASEVKGLVVPTGGRSALFFGRHGLGQNCYGTGPECNDPTSPDKGYHAYPYAQYVWAYDLNEMVAVKNGSRQPWELRPHAMWSLNLPFSNNTKRLNGAAYDPATGRLFVSAHSDTSAPIIHVLTVTGLGSGGTVPAPASPSNVRVIR